MNIYSFLVTFNLPQLLTKSQRITEEKAYFLYTAGGRSYACLFSVLTSQMQYIDQ